MSGINFIDVGCKGSLLNHRFVINVGQFYALYDIKHRDRDHMRYMSTIKVERIENKSIYYRDVNDYTDGGEFTKSVIRKYEDAGRGDDLVFIANIRLGTAEKFIPVTNFSGTENSEPLYWVSQLNLIEGLVREGGRNKRGRKSKKYSKTKSKSRTRRGGRRSRCHSIKKSKYNQLKHQIGGAGEVYQLIDDIGNIMEIEGETKLTFNTDRTPKSFHETNTSMILRGDGSATQCYFVPATNSWYQLINMKDIIYQVSADGQRKRRVQLKSTAPQLSDDDIAALLHVPVHSGTDTYPEWERGLLKALQTGAASVIDIKRILQRQMSAGDDKLYLGARWLTPRLQQFVDKYPEYKSMIPKY